MEEGFWTSWAGHHLGLKGASLDGFFLGKTLKNLKQPRQVGIFKAGNFFCSKTGDIDFFHHLDVPERKEVRMDQWLGF